MVNTSIFQCPNTPSSERWLYGSWFLVSRHKPAWSWWHHQGLSSQAVFRQNTRRTSDASATAYKVKGKMEVRLKRTVGNSRTDVLVLLENVLTQGFMNLVLDHECTETRGNRRATEMTEWTGAPGELRDQSEAEQSTQRHTRAAHSARLLVILQLTSVHWMMVQPKKTFLFTFHL